jgi:hypothetical protein
MGHAVAGGPTAGLQWVPVALVLVEVGMADCFLTHAPGPHIDASIEPAERPAASRGSCHGAVAAR